jgi:hypothetical protein
MAEPSVAQGTEDGPHCSTTPDGHRFGVGLLRRVRWRKVLGVAGFAGVAATGVLIARAERRHTARSPQEIGEHLHARYDGDAR